LPFAADHRAFISLSAALGIGKALVYPTFAAAIAERTPASARGRSIGSFRFFRDLGYAGGAALTGIVADAFGIRSAMLLVAALTALSAVAVQAGLKARPEPVS
ncbi:MAG: MFS transporter, partial [Chitinophagaceae bacterium]